MIDAHTQLLGIIGDPISHSLSPIMHHWIIQKLKLNLCYHAFRVPAPNLKNAINGFQALDFVGINVTIPHKERVIPFIDFLSDDAKIVGAANTLRFDDGKIYGYNTDIIGFQKVVGAIVDRIKGATAIVFGAGGSARAVVKGLINDGIGKIIIYNRSFNNGERIVQFIKHNLNFQRCEVMPFTNTAISAGIQDAALMINTTPLGMYPNVMESPLNEDIVIPHDMIVMDLIYNPRETQFLKNAKKAGAMTINGLDMLIHQGIASLQIWIDQKINIDALMPDLRNVLNKEFVNSF